MVIYKCRLRYVRCLLYFCLFLNPDREIVTSFFKGKIYICLLDADCIALVVITQLILASIALHILKEI